MAEVFLLPFYLQMSTQFFHLFAPFGLLGILQKNFLLTIFNVCIYLLRWFSCCFVIIKCRCPCFFYDYYLRILHFIWNRIRNNQCPTKRFKWSDRRTDIYKYRISSLLKNQTFEEGHTYIV